MEMLNTARTSRSPIRLKCLIRSSHHGLVLAPLSAWRSLWWSIGPLRATSTQFRPGHGWLASVGLQALRGTS